MGRRAVTTPVLLYDGGCGLCARSVQWILRRDRRGTLRFAPLEGRYAAAVRAAYPELRDADSVVWVEPAEGRMAERVLVRSDAALAAAEYLGGVWRLALIGRLVPRLARDAAYRFVARHRHRHRHRHRLSGGTAACAMPVPDAAARFLD
jgi:predicted DCC family thiol-disulfide oxidoreductase YuxK